MEIIGPVLITGASGRLGRLIGSALSSRGASVVGVDLKPSAGIKALDLAGDLEGVSQLLEETKPPLVFHAAAVLSGSDALAQYRSNVMMAAVLTEAIGRMKPGARPKVINLSSAAELGVPVEPEKSRDKPVLEDCPCRPITAYGASKLCQTEIILAASRRFGFKAVSTRIFNFLGLPNSPELPVQSWVDQLRAMKNGGERVLLTGNTSVVRDFIDVKEAVKILLELAAASDAEGIVNVASGTGTKLSVIIDYLRELSGINFEVKQDPARLRSKDVMRVVASTDRLVGLIGRPVQFNLKGSLADMLGD